MLLKIIEYVLIFLFGIGVFYLVFRFTKNSSETIVEDLQKLGFSDRDIIKHISQFYSDHHIHFR